jgi:predicted permease
MERWIQDIRYAARSLARQPGFAAIAILTIALGIGANTSIFSVVRAVLLRPLPYENPGRLVIVWSNLVKRHRPKFPMSPPDLRDLREQTRQFTGFAGITTFQQTLTGEGRTPEQIAVAGITANYLDLLGIRPILGRGFLPGEDDPFGANVDPATLPPPSVVISHGLWMRHFGGDPHVLGRTIEINNNSSRVVGVLPPDVAIYFGPGSGLATTVDVWTALRIDVAAWPARRNVIWSVVGRMKPGVTIQQARADVARVSAQLVENDNLRQTAGFRLDIFPMMEDLTAEVRPVVWALFGAVAFVLLIACANVSNLFLVRASGREREFAIRTALGGARSRLVRQLLVESGLLALAGGAAGLLLAFGGIRLLIALRPANLPRLDTIAIDGPVLGFTALVAMTAALLFGLVPALQASRPRMSQALKDRGRSAALAGQRLFQNALVIVEVALSVLLLIGAGLMVRSFVRLQRVDLGYRPDRLLTFNVALPGNRYTAEQRRVFFRSFQERVGALPGVRSMSAAFPLPLIDVQFNGRYGPEEALGDETRYGQADYRAVLPGYFTTMGTRVIAGRAFDESDVTDSAKVAIVDDQLAAVLWPNQSAIGKRMLVRATTLDPQFVEVVGVVAHERAHGIATPGPETVYLTNHYLGDIPTVYWVVRTSGDPAGLAGPVRSTLAAMDPLLPMADVRTMESRVDEAMTGTRFSLVLIGVFGAVALILAAVGIYGVLSYSVRQRAGEFGVRMALGADAGSILRLVVRQGLTLTAWGLVAGVGAGLWATRLMTSLLVGVSPTDPLTFALMTVVLIAAAAAACYAPARRATRVDPVVALREE